MREQDWGLNVTEQDWGLDPNVGGGGSNIDDWPTV
jgi:hypothetical protein